MDGHCEDDFKEIAKEELDRILSDILSQKMDIDYLEKATKYLSEGNSKKALEEYETALSKNPEDPIIYQCLGNFYTNEGNFDEALCNYKKALQIDSSLPFTHNNIGLVYVKLGKLDEAICEFKQAIELAPGEGDFLNNLGNAIAQKGRYQEAIDYLKQALSINPSNIRYKFNLAIGLHKNNQINDALKIYEDIIALQPENKKVLEQIIFIYKYERKHEKALEYLDKLISISCSDIELREKGNLLRELKRYEEAFNVLQEAISINPDAKNLSSFELLGHFCIRGDNRKPEIARKVFSTLIEKEPEKRDFYNSLGISLRRLGKFNEAIDIYKKGIEIDPSWGEIRQSLGNVYADSGNLDDAVKEFLKASEISPNDPWVYGKTGHIYQLKGEYGKAIDYFEKALSIDPNLAEACISAGIAYYYLENDEKAEEYFYRATMLDPLNISAHDCWIEMSVKRKNLKKAIDRYEGELARLPEQPVLHYASGLCSFYRYQLDKAAKSIDMAISLNPGFHQAYSLRGFISYEMKNFNEAIEYNEKALKLEPDESNYEYNIAYYKKVKGEKADIYFEKVYMDSPKSSTGKCGKAFLLMETGDFPGAENMLKEAIKDAPKFSEPYFVTGILYEKLNEPKKALEYYEKAYKLNPLDFDSKRSMDRLSLKSDGHE